MKSETLTANGLIFGQSATAASKNVYERLRALEKLRPFSGGVAADLGCGKGGYTIELAKRFDRVVAMDILPSNIEYARARFPQNVECYCGTLEDNPLESEHIDAAFIIEVLDHVVDLQKSLEEVIRILKPHSNAYISVPNALFPFETHPIKLLGRLFHPMFFPFLNWTPFHDRLATARIFRKRELAALCESIGFRVIGSGYVSIPLEHRLKFLRPIATALARTSLRPFVGVSLVLVLQKPGRSD